MREEGNQLYFPFSGEVRCSPEVFDYFKKSFSGIHKRISDMTDLIAHMEQKLLERQDEFSARIRKLELEVGQEIPCKVQGF